MAGSTLMTLDQSRPDDAWTIIIPVKDTRFAKTRLSPFSQPVRAALALAFALDATTAALTCPAVRAVLAVTNDDAAARELERVGAQVVSDTPNAGLNAALRHGAAHVRRHDPGLAVAAMSGDLPAVRTVDLTAAFAAAAALPRWFVADADGIGTTLLAVKGAQPLAPSFGPRSRHEHRLSGATDLELADLERLRRDVDTVEHLWQAVRLGVGLHTARALAHLDLDLRSVGIA
jgi:2-phospho-L-lactate/phosphoenolpyruvate guanylyltransferase